ncbi:VOC family protein, partial [Phenylobacterium sp.]
FDFYGHQIVAHLAPDEVGHRQTSAVDGEQVPVRHFGVILTLQAWQDLADRLQAAGTDFIIAPQVRFKGQPGEQATLFFLDPSGNALEFKAFANDDMVFAK